MSVVVPVYNAMPYLLTLLRSLVAQDLPPDEYEVIAIDDGSTDDGPGVLDEFAAQYPQLRVIHQPNSGWPGIPRNRGLELARGRYVFFADADDQMGPESLRRMVDFADEHGTDVLVPQAVGVGGRWVRDIFEVTQVDADIETIFTTLTPQKMFRRSFLREQGITFPEEKVRLEDGMVLAVAYLRARRVSILGGYPYYYLVARDDGQNISSQKFDPEGYTWSIGEVSRLVRENDPDPERADRIILDLYRRKCLKFYAPHRWLAMPPARRAAFLAAHGAFIETYISPEAEATLAEPFRSRSALVRAGDDAGLLALARDQLNQPLVSATLVKARWRQRGGLRLTLEVRGAHEGRDPRPLDLVVRRRGGGATHRTPMGPPRRVRELDGQPTTAIYVAKVRRRSLLTDASAVLDLDVAVHGTKERARVAAPLLSSLPTPRPGVRAYATVQHNLSIELAAG